MDCGLQLEQVVHKGEAIRTLLTEGVELRLSAGSARTSLAYTPLHWPNLITFASKPSFPMASEDPERATLTNPFMDCQSTIGSENIRLRSEDVRGLGLLDRSSPSRSSNLRGEAGSSQFPPCEGRVAASS